MELSQKRMIRDGEDTMKKIVCVVLSLLLVLSGMGSMEIYAGTVMNTAESGIRLSSIEGITPGLETSSPEKAATQEETAESEDKTEPEETVGQGKATEPEETKEPENKTEPEETAGQGETIESEDETESGKTSEPEEITESENKTESEETIRRGKSTESEETAESEETTGVMDKTEAGEITGLEDKTAAGETTEPEEEAIRVLIVGNSFSRYTSNGVSYSVKRPLKDLAEGEGHNLKITTLAHSSARLRYYAGMNEAYLSYHKELLTLLVNKEWDYIIFQEQSTAPIEYFDTSTYPAVETLLQMVKKFQPQATPLLYMIQGYSNGTSVKVNGVSKVLRTEEMQLYLAAAYASLENKLGVEVVPVGIHAIRANMLYPQIEMRGPDAKHPTYAGYYLAACSFYQRIYGAVPDPRKASLKNCNITEQELVLLASLTADSMKINKKEITLNVNKTAKLKAVPSSHISGDSRVTYKSLDTSVAAVNPATGVVTAKGGGSTCIVAETSDGLQAFCNVTVRIPLSFARSCYLAGIGDKIQILPQTNSENLKWNSNKKSVAAVSEGVVTAKASGKAVITVTNREDTTDKATYTLYVTCAAPTGLKAASSGNPAEGASVGKIKISWSAVTGAARYEIYRSTSKNGTYKLIGTSKKTSYTDKNASVNKCYYYKVKAKNKYKYCTSPLSSSTRGIILKATTLKVNYTASKYVKLTWKKNTKATGYVIYRSGKKNSGYKKIATVSSKAVTSYIDKTVNKKKTYYYRIKAYKELNGKVFYGVKSQKVKI